MKFTVLVDNKPKSCGECYFNTETLKSPKEKEGKAFVCKIINECYLLHKEIKEIKKCPLTEAINIKGVI